MKKLSPKTIKTLRELGIMFVHMFILIFITGALVHALLSMIDNINTWQFIFLGSLYTALFIACAIKTVDSWFDKIDELNKNSR